MDPLVRGQVDVYRGIPLIPDQTMECTTNQESQGCDGMYLRAIEESNRGCMSCIQVLQFLIRKGKLLAQRRLLKISRARLLFLRSEMVLDQLQFEESESQGED